MGQARTILTVILIAALLCVRLAGTHLHLCMDGGEPEAKLQLQSHDVAEAIGEKSKNPDCSKHDFDFDPLGDLMAKIAKIGLDSSVFIATAILLFLLPPATAPLRSWLPEPLLAPHRPGIRPPLRAPPL